MEVQKWIWNLDMRNPSEAVALMKQFATEIEEVLSRYGIDVEISDLVIWGLPFVSKGTIALGILVVGFVANILHENKLTKQVIEEHARSFYLTLYDKWIRERSESSGTIEKIFWSNTAYARILRKSMKRVTPDSVVMSFRNPRVAEAMTSIVHSELVNNISAGAKAESQEILHAGKLPLSIPYIWALIYPPSYDRTTGEICNRRWFARFTRQKRIWWRTLTQVEYLRIPKSHYEQIKATLKHMADTMWMPDIKTFLDDVSVNGSEKSNAVINALFYRLFGKQEITGTEAQQIIIEKKQLLHIIHIIRHELAWWYIRDESVRWRQPKKPASLISHENTTIYEGSI